MSKNLLTLVIALVVELVATAATVIAGHFSSASEDEFHGRPD